MIRSGFGEEFWRIEDVDRQEEGDGAAIIETEDPEVTLEEAIETEEPRIVD